MKSEFGWQNPLFYLGCVHKITFQTVIKSICLWIFFYNRSEIWTFTRVLGLYYVKYNTM